MITEIKLSTKKLREVAELSCATDAECRPMRGLGEYWEAANRRAGVGGASLTAYWLYTGLVLSLIQAANFEN